MDHREWGEIVDADVLVLGGGAAGCGAAIAAMERGASVVLVEKEKLESSGCLGGGNDHFIAVLNSGPDTDTGQAVVDFYKTPLSGLTAKMIEDGWVKNMPIIMALLQDIGVEFVRDEQGGWLRTVGFGQPRNWWVHIKNGMTIKKRLAKKVRDLGVHVMDDVMVTLLLKGNGKVTGCIGFNVLDGTFLRRCVATIGNKAGRSRRIPAGVRQQDKASDFRRLPTSRYWNPSGGRRVAAPSPTIFPVSPPIGCRWRVAASRPDLIAWR